MDAIVRGTVMYLVQLRVCGLHGCHSQWYCNVSCTAKLGFIVSCLSIKSMYSIKSRGIAYYSYVISDIVALFDY